MIYASLQAKGENLGICAEVQCFRGVAGRSCAHPNPVLHQCVEAHHQRSASMVENVHGVPSGVWIPGAKVLTLRMKG